MLVEVDNYLSASVFLLIRAITEAILSMFRKKHKKIQGTQRLMYLGFVIILLVYLQKFLYNEVNHQDDGLK